MDTAAPGRGEVRIVQRAIGVNFIDTYFRSGLYPWPSTPLIPGAEAAGVVAEVGEGVGDLKAGDRVAYTLPLGAYRTQRVVPAETAGQASRRRRFDVAASVMLKGLTAQFLLTSCYPVKAGDTVLVHAAAGGVGLLLGQWLKVLGAISIGTAGSPEKAAIAKANGYTHVIDYRAEDFVGAGQGDHRIQGLRRGLRFGGQGHVARLAQMSDECAACSSTSASPRE